MTPEELARLQADAWKTTIEVQKHFNDIEWKIRGLALTLLAAVLGASAVAIREKTQIRLFGQGCELSTALLVVGLIVWLLFYFVDQIWYHRLLIGAVKHGERLETLLSEGVAGFELTQGISTESPYTVNLHWWRPELHSRHKLQVFYFGVAVLLLLFTIVAQLGSQHTGESSNTHTRSQGATHYPASYNFWRAVSVEE